LELDLVLDIVSGWLCVFPLQTTGVERIYVSGRWGGGVVRYTIQQQTQEKNQPVATTSDNNDPVVTCWDQPPRSGRQKKWDNEFEFPVHMIHAPVGRLM
jgi:hypothetical protein